MTNRPQNDEKAIADVLTRAAIDGVYRKRLLTDPVNALSEVTGSAPPAHFKVKFVEKEPGVDAMFVLPDLVDANGELSVEELEAVAGGDCWFTCGNTCQGCSQSISTSEPETIA